MSDIDLTPLQALHTIGLSEIYGIDECTNIERAVDAIFFDIADRRGLKHEWSQIDNDVKDEIRDMWVKIITYCVERE